MMAQIGKILGVVMLTSLFAMVPRSARALSQGGAKEKSLRQVSFSAEASADRQDGSNILLILADDMGYGDFPEDPPRSSATSAFPVTDGDADWIIPQDPAYYAQNTEGHVYTNASGKTMPYRLFVPKNRDPKKKYPLVFFLHGAGARGDDNVRHLLPWFAGWTDDAVQKEHPCFILMPQCPANQKWVNTPWKNGSYSIKNIPISTPMTLAKEIFDQVVAENPIDETRIYVVGLSMGGYGAWNFIMRYPDLVTAAVACCGAGDPSMAYRLKDLPIWAFHGDKDTIVPFEGSKDMVNAIKEEGGEIKFTIYENFGHQAHKRAWKSKALVEWLFSQKSE